MLFDFVRAAFASPRRACTDLSRRLRDGVSLKTNWFLLEWPLLPNLHQSRIACGSKARRKRVNYQAVTELTL